MSGRVSKLLFSKHSYYCKQGSSTISLGGLHCFSTSSSSSSHYDDDDDNKPPNPIPNRPLRGDKRRDSFNLGKDFDGKMKPSRQIPRTQHFENRGEGGGRMREDYGSRKEDLNLFNDMEEEEEEEEVVDVNHVTHRRPPVQVPNSNKPRPMSGEKRDDQSVTSFLEKFHLNIDDEKKYNDSLENKNTQMNPETLAAMSYPKQEKEEELRPPPPPPKDADEIFKEMKETGLIPNAVAMLDGLCKDGLLQEAMKLFGLMREKGTMPEVVIYTAVVDGFCKAHKLDDAKRIFRKMQNNGIIPNAFSYTVLIQGLLGKDKGMRRLEDALDFCVEMLEAGHSPNLATYVSLVDGFVTDKGMEESKRVIGILREKGFFVDDKSVRAHLDKTGSFSSLVWEAFLGKKTSPF